MTEETQQQQQQQIALFKATAAYIFFQLGKVSKEMGLGEVTSNVPIVSHRTMLVSS